jgi:hypothetical protein
MNENPMDEVRLAELLRELPPAPQTWIQCAQDRPAIARAADQVLELAEADAEFRKTLIADLEEALRVAGHEPDQRLVETLRRRLPGS